MADLSQIKVGDKLRFTGNVSNVLESGVAVELEGAATWFTWLPFSGSTLEAAEHIPAPRVFKRGDWVKWNDGEDDFRHCIVLGKSETRHPELLRVDVPGEGVCELFPSFLEPDEAPE